MSALNARCKASLASRARTSADLLPRGTANVNTGASPRRTIAGAELFSTDALGDVDAIKLGGGATGSSLARGGATTTGAGAGAGAGAGGGAEIAGTGGSGSVSAADALAEGCGAAEALACGVADAAATECAEADGCA